MPCTSPMMQSSPETDSYIHKLHFCAAWAQTRNSTCHARRACFAAPVARDHGVPTAVDRLLTGRAVQVRALAEVRQRGQRGCHVVFAVAGHASGTVVGPTPGMRGVQRAAALGCLVRRSAGIGCINAACATKCFVACRAAKSGVAWAARGAAPSGLGRHCKASVSRCPSRGANVERRAGIGSNWVGWGADSAACSSLGLRHAGYNTTAYDISSGESMATAASQTRGCCAPGLAAGKKVGSNTAVAHTVMAAGGCHWAKAFSWLLHFTAQATADDTAHGVARPAWLCELLPYGKKWALQSGL